MTVQPIGVANRSSPMLLDLPNVNTNLPPPLRPNPSSHYHQQHHNQVHQTELNNPGQVTNSEILKSIQSIMEVMQHQLLLNSKTTEQGIVQTASLFQEMIKAQEKRDLDPALLAIPTFSGEAKDRLQCLDWVSRVKNVCDQSGRSFCQELINKAGVLVQNFIRSLSENITNKELAEKIEQFFSDVPMTSHALNKLRLIRQGAEEPIVNYNQRYQNLVERVEGCQLDSIRSTVAMESCITLQKFIQFQQGLTKLRQVVSMIFQFQGNNYANEHEMQGRFHHQRVSCRLDFEETRRMSSFF